MRARTRPGATWTPMAAGMTYPARATSGRLTTLRTRDGIPTAPATGCTLPATDTSGPPVIRGAICLTSAAPGTSTTTLAGAGLREWAVASRGGARASTADRGSAAICRVAIVRRAGLLLRRVVQGAAIRFR